MDSYRYNTAHGETSLPQDPHNILPLSSTSSKPSHTSRHTSPPLSRRASAIELYTEPGPSTYAGTPRTSSSVSSSSRNGWTSNRSDDGLSEDTEGGYHLEGSRSRLKRGDESDQAIPLSRRDRPPRRAKDGFRGSFLEKSLDMLGMGNSERSRKRFRIGGNKDKELEKLTGPGFSRRKNDQNYTSTWKQKLLALIPRTLIGMVAFLLCFAMFAATLTLTLKYVLNPDKKALPWRKYCSADYPTLFSLQDPKRPNGTGTGGELLLAPLTPQHPNWPYPGYDTRPYDASLQADLDLSPVGVYLGVFTMDSGKKKRDLVRESYGSHWRSRRNGTESVSVRFIMGRPRPEFAAAVDAESKDYGDIVILDIKENMNSGKTHAYFTWAAENAMVPHYQYTEHAGKSNRPVLIGEKRPDYIVKADDDAFIMLGELERRLRAIPRSKAFWGYLVKNRFMGGECYALSLDLVQYIANTEELRSMTVGKEDVLVSKWMKRHPEREDIVWASESCWIYDHPKAGTVYSHGFIYPSTIETVRKELKEGISPRVAAMRGGKEKDSYSSVTRFGTPYRTLLHDMSEGEKVEALVEGSLLSQVRDEMEFRPAEYNNGETLRHRVDRLFRFRPSRVERFLGDEKERGGTVLVHYIKRVEWFRETAMAILGLTERQAARLGSGEAKREV